MAQGDVENDQARLQEAARILAIQDETARKAALVDAASKAANPGDEFNNLSKAISKLEAENKHTLAADVTSFNTPVGTLRAEAATGLNGQGLTGASASMFTGVMDNPTLGAASVGVTGSMDGKGALGDPSLSARYVTPTLINNPDSSVEAVGIGAVGVAIPTTDRQFTGADVSLAAGGVVFDKPTGVAFTGVVSTDGTGKAPAVWGRVSGNVYEDDSTKLAANLNGGYDTANKTATVGTGLFVEEKISPTSTVYASASLNVGDVGGKNNLGAAFNLGATFDVMPTQEQKAQSTSSAPPTQVAEAEKPHNLNYDFRSLSKEDQKTVIGFMTESTGKPEAEIRSQLEKAGYKVNAHGTENYKDDTPMRVEEQVASR